MSALSPRQIVSEVARRLGLHRTWIPGIRPFRLLDEGKEFIPCHACGAVDYRPFIREPQHQVVHCLNCGLYYANPVPTESVLSQRVHDSAAYTEDQLAKRSFFRRRAADLLARVESHIQCGRLLDIGCAIGTELVVGRERGWQVTGVELSENSLRVAQDAQLDVLSQPLVQVGFPSHAFDLITMNHVLEHVAHTPTFMNEIRRILSNRGLLFISLPNVHAWPFYFRRGAYGWTFHEDHFIHFSVQTLSRFLNRHGFEVIDISTSRWLDFHDPIQSHSRLFQTMNRAIERRHLGIEIFCLAKPIDGGRISTKSSSTVNVNTP